MDSTNTLIVQTVLDNIVIPILVAIGSVVLVIIKSYAKKVTESVIAKNEINSLSTITSIKNNLLVEIATVVQSAVFTNMSLADTLKLNSNGKLTDADIAMLQKSAREMVYKTLPDSLINDDGALMKIVGGRDKLDAIIDTQLEQAVIEAKTKVAAALCNK